MELDLADIKPSVLNAIILTLTVVVTLNFLKFIVSQPPFSRLPGLPQLIQNA